MNEHELLTEVASSFLNRMDGVLNEATAMPSEEEIQKLIDQYGTLEKLDPEDARRRTEKALADTYKMSAQEAYDYLINHTETPKEVVVSALMNRGANGSIGLTYLVSRYKSADEEVYLNN